MKILSFDPGVVSGWCAMKEGRIAGGSFPMHSGVENLLKKFHPDAVVVESFRLFPWKAGGQSFSRFETVEVIGVIKLLAEKHGVKVVMQQPAEVTLIKIKRILKFDKHARSALKHGLLYAIRNGFGGLYKRFRKAPDVKAVDKLRASLERG